MNHPVGLAQSGGRVRRGDADDLHFCGARGGDADGRILEHHAPLRQETEPLRAEQKNFRVRLPCVTSAAATMSLKKPCSPTIAITASISSPGRGRADAADDAGLLEPLQKQLHARQSRDPGFADDIPVKLLLQPGTTA